MCRLSYNHWQISFAVYDAESCLRAFGPPCQSRCTMQNDVSVYITLPTAFVRRQLDPPTSSPFLPTLQIPAGSLTNSDADEGVRLSPSTRYASSSGSPASERGAYEPSFPPFVSDSAYVTPAPRTPLERDLHACLAQGDVQRALRLMSSARVEPAAVSAAPLDGFIAAGATVSAFEQVLKWRGWNFAFCGPMRAAVASGRIDLIPILLSDLRVDPNIGQPLRVAVAIDSREAFEKLLQSPRINPNRGHPLFHAAMANKVYFVRKLMHFVPHHHASVHSHTPYSTPADAISPIGPAIVVVAMNRLVNQYAMTPLIATIHSNALDAFYALLSDSRVLINRGYCYTPLQVAIRHQRPLFVRALLARDDLEPTKVLGPEVLPPVWMALNGRPDILHMLLRDARVAIDPELIDALEEADDLDSLDLLVHTRPRLGTPMGNLWTWRTVAAVVYVTLVFVCSLVDGLRLMFAVASRTDHGEGEKVFKARVLMYVLCGLVTGVMHYRRVKRAPRIRPSSPTADPHGGFDAQGAAVNSGDMEQIIVDNGSMCRVPLQHRAPQQRGNAAGFPPQGVSYFRSRLGRRGWFKGVLRRVLCGSGEGFAALSLGFRVLLLCVPLIPIGEMVGGGWVFAAVIGSRLNVASRDFHYGVVAHCAVVKAALLFLPLMGMSAMEVVYALAPTPKAPKGGIPARASGGPADVFEGALLVCLYLTTFICAVSVWLARPRSKRPSLTPLDQPPTFQSQ